MRYPIHKNEQQQQYHPLQQQQQQQELQHSFNKDEKENRYKGGTFDKIHQRIDDDDDGGGDDHNKMEDDNNQVMNDAHNDGVAVHITRRHHPATTTTTIKTSTVPSIYSSIPTMDSNLSLPSIEFVHNTTTAATTCLTRTTRNKNDNDDNLMMTNDTCVITIDEAIERIGYGPFQYRILIAAGCCFAADAMEILLLSFLSVILQSEWDLNTDETAGITSSVFVGALFGTLILGNAGDQYGRKIIFIITAAIISIFGICTAFVTSYKMFLLVRCCVGFGVGGLTVPFDILAEFVPCQQRGTNLLLIEYFWTIGTLLVPFLAYLCFSGYTPPIPATTPLYNNTVYDYDISNSYDSNIIITTDQQEQQLLDSTTVSPVSWFFLFVAPWRLFTFLCALPCVIATILGTMWVPESPRWLLSIGKKENALNILREAAIQNGQDPFVTFPLGIQIIDDENDDDNDNDTDNLPNNNYENNGGTRGMSEEKSRRRKTGGSVFDLLKPKWRRITLTLWGVWSGFAMSYYGTILMISYIFSTKSSTTEEDNNYNNQYGADSSSSHTTTNPYSFDYGAIFVSASAEIAGTTLMVWTVDRTGRIPLQSLSYLLGAISIGTLCYLASNNPVHDQEKDLFHFDTTTKNHTASMFDRRTVLVSLAFLARMFSMSASCATWVSTAEILTTEIRTTGHSTANAMARISGAITPFVMLQQQNQDNDNKNYNRSGMILLIIGTITSYLVYQLPETKGKNMGTSTTTTPNTTTTTTHTTMNRVQQQQQQRPFRDNET